AAGMDDYLTKPIRSATLFETLERVARPASRKNGEPNGGVAPDATAVSPCAPQDDPLLDSTRAFDPAHVLALVADDRDLLGKLVALFRSESRRLMGLMRQSLDAGDSTALARAAHTLKGAVGNFGITRSFECARRL